MIKCLHCGEELETINGVHKEYENGLNIVITNTPISMCNHCMEEYLSAESMYTINTIVNNITKNKQELKDDIIIINFKDKEYQKEFSV